MNLVDVQLEQLDVAATIFDEDFNVPVGGAAAGKARGPAIDLRAQANFGQSAGGNRWEQRAPSRTGDATDSAGHLVFRASDLDDAGVVVKKGDRVISIAGRGCDYLVREVRPESLLGGKFLLLYVELEENKERRASV